MIVMRRRGTRLRRIIMRMIMVITRIVSMIILINEHENNDNNDVISDKLYHFLAECMILGLFSSISPAAIV
jgi:hypothetical protein